jgi:short-subunit dehydrogenase
MKKAIIIGATSGIGKELAMILCQNDYHVGVTGRRTELLQALEKDFPGNIFTETFDVTGNENLVHFSSLVEKLGGLDLLVYNSGFGEPSEKLEPEIDRITIRTNVNGFTEITNYAFNYFVKQGSGHLVGISSIASNRGSSWAPAYSASKAFMSNYLEGLQMKARKIRLSENPANIVVTDIQPGFVGSKMAKGNKQFWVVPLDKAARQIYHAIKTKKRKAYISKRWRLIAILLRIIPYTILKRIM